MAPYGLFWRVPKRVVGPPLFGLWALLRPKSAGFWTLFGPTFGPKMDPFWTPFWTPFWDPLGPQGGAIQDPYIASRDHSLGPGGGPNMDPKGTQKGSLFGPLFGPPF